MNKPAAAYRISASATLRVVEMFGPTLQGEGATVGRSAKFLRLAGCNLSCAWCDTAYTWDPKRQDSERPAHSVTTRDVISGLDPRVGDARAEPPLVRRLVVTGGEPLLQASQLVDVVAPLRALGWVVEVETSGTVSPGPLATLPHHFNVSPKLAHSGVQQRARIRFHVLEEFAALESAIFKFVVQSLSDLDEIAGLLGELSTPVVQERVFVMAQATASGPLIAKSKELVDAVVARGWALTPRWHILLWDDERGH